MKRIFLIFLLLMFISSPVWAGGSKGTYRIHITVSGSSVYPNAYTVAKHAGADYVYLGDKWVDGYFNYAFDSIGGVTAAGTTGISVYCQEVMTNDSSAWAVSGVSWIIINMDAWSGATRVPVYCSPKFGEYYRIGFQGGNSCAPTGTLSIR